MLSFTYPDRLHVGTVMMKCMGSLLSYLLVNMKAGQIQSSFCHGAGQMATAMTALHLDETIKAPKGWWVMRYIIWL